jgi:hypothetical protein
MIRNMVALVLLVSTAAHAGTVIAIKPGSYKVENVVSIKFVEAGVVAYVAEDADKRYFTSIEKINKLGLSKKEFADILLSKKSVMEITLDYQNTVTKISHVELKK